MSRLSPDVFEPGDAQRLRWRLGWVTAQGAAWMALPGVVMLCVVIAGIEDHWPWGILAVVLVVPGLVAFGLSGTRRSWVAEPYADAALQSRAWWWGLWVTGLGIPRTPPPDLGAPTADAVVGRIAVRRWPLWTVSIGCAVATAWLFNAPIPERMDSVITVGLVASAVSGWAATARLVAGPRPGRVVLEADADELWVDYGALRVVGDGAAGYGAFSLRWSRVQRVALSRVAGGRLVMDVTGTTGATYTADLTHAWLDLAALEACVERHTGHAPDVQTR